MKLLKFVAKNMLHTQKDVLVHYVSSGKWTKLDIPAMSSTIVCPKCNGKEHYAPYVNPPHSQKRVWICGGTTCVRSGIKNEWGAMDTQVISRRCIEWPLFCEKNDIGDVHHDVSFEKLNQSNAKLEFLRQFACKPSGIVLMYGNAGTGKTYSSMAVCELFTRANRSCLFITQKKMMSDWLDNTSNQNDFIQKLNSVSLLVIDDFGTKEPSPGFMSFFMDLINSRMQWKERGTIITTNLNEESLSTYCGEALSDRLYTGQMMIFDEKSRRKAPIT